MKYITITTVSTLFWLAVLYAMARLGVSAHWQWFVTMVGAIGVCTLLVRTVDYCLGPRPRYRVEIRTLSGEWVDAGIGSYANEADAQAQIDLAESLIPAMVTVPPMAYRVVKIPPASGGDL